jgi:hypothetical protein
MMEAERISETSVENYFTRQYIPEDNSEQRVILFGSLSKRSVVILREKRSFSLYAQQNNMPSLLGCTRNYFLYKYSLFSCSKRAQIHGLIFKNISRIDTKYLLSLRENFTLIS